MIRAVSPPANGISAQDRDALIERMSHDVMMQLCAGVDTLSARHGASALAIWRMQHEVLHARGKAGDYSYVAA